MPMPKGKTCGPYVILRDRQSMKFRRIATVMTQAGDRMNHATARGVLLKGIEKIAIHVLKVLKGYSDPADVQRLLKNEAFQSYIGEVLDEDEVMRQV